MQQQVAGFFFSVMKYLFCLVFKSWWGGTWVSGGKVEVGIVVPLLTHLYVCVFVCLLADIDALNLFQ